jgi:hypothetical protein
MIHKKIVVFSFLAMFGAETMDLSPANLLLEQSETDNEHWSQLEREETVGQSKAISCVSWSEINEEVIDHINCHRNKRVFVGLDADNTLIEGSHMVDGETIPQFLTTLGGRGIPFFCLTAYNSSAWPWRRKGFNDSGLSNYFRNSESNRPFVRGWEKSRDNNKRYYWDLEYSTMYSNRMRANEHFSEENPSLPESGVRQPAELYQSDLLLRTSKGEVFRSAIEDEVIAKPEVMVFVDDDLGSVYDVCLVCQRLGINCLGINYEGYN